MMKFLVVILLHNIIATTAEKNPLCANEASSADTELLYHEGTRKCYPTRVKCDGMMLFYPTGDGYGDCDCDLRLQWSKGRKIVYWHPHKRCYWFHERGPCQRKEWLELDEETGQAVCRVNPCFEAQQRDNSSSNTHDFWFYRFDKCWKNGMLGKNCPDKPEYPDFRIYYTHKNFDKYGNCIGRPSFTGGWESVGSLPCQPGHRFYGHSKICKRADKLHPNYASLNGCTSLFGKCNKTNT